MSNYLSSEEIEFKNDCSITISEIQAKLNSIADLSGTMKSELEDLKVLLDKSHVLCRKTSELFADSTEKNIVFLGLSEISTTAIDSISEEQIDAIKSAAESASSSVALTGHNIDEAIRNMEFIDEEDD